MSDASDARALNQNTVSILQHLKELIDANDRRYQEQFESQRQAVATAMTAQEKAVRAALDASDRAVNKAETATNERLVAMNEFRAALNDQTRTYMPRLETENRLSALDEKLASIIKRSDTTEGQRSGYSSVWAVFVGAVVAAAAVSGMVAAFMHK